MKIKVFSEDNQNDCLSVRFKKVCCAFGVLGFFGANIVGIGEVSAIDISPEVMLNPVYQHYEQDMLNGDGDKWNIIPNKYIYSKVDSELFGKGSGSSLPASYSLIEEGYGTKIKNQGSDSACWAFSAITAIESNLKKTHGLDVDLSPKQLDYISAEGTPYFNYINSNFGATRNLGEGGNFMWASFALDGKYAPVSETSFFNKLKANDSDLNSFSGWKEYQDVNSLGGLFFGEAEAYTKALDSSITMGDISDYVVTKYRFHNTNDDNLVNEVKNDVYRYGASYVETFAPETENCWDAETETIIDRGEEVCNSENGHAMAIIGWDDNHVYKDPATGKTKIGAFLLQNSWGDSSLLEDYGYTDYNSIVDILIEAEMIENESDLSPEQRDYYKKLAMGVDMYEYVWLGYEYESSQDLGGTLNAASIQEVRKNDYKNVYDTVNQVAASNTNNELVGEIINTFSTGGETEYIDAVSVDSHSVIFEQNIQYVFYIDPTNTGDRYQEVGTVTINAAEIGKETIDLDNKIEVNGDFKVKIIFKINGQAVNMRRELASYITMSAYTSDTGPEEIIEVPNTGLFTKDEQGLKNVIILTFGMLGMSSVGFVMIKNRKNLFHRVKFNKK